MAKRTRSSATALQFRGKAKPRGKPFKGKDDPRRAPGFPPGKSGNPGGVPKNRDEAAAYIERELQEHVAEIVTALRLHALKGSPTHMVEALNRMAGKVVDRTELTGKDGEPISVSMEKRAARVARFETMLQRMKAKEETKP